MYQDFTSARQINHATLQELGSPSWSSSNCYLFLIFFLSLPLSFLSSLVPVLPGNCAYLKTKCIITLCLDSQSCAAMPSTAPKSGQHLAKCYNAECTDYSRLAGNDSIICTWMSKSSNKTSYIPSSSSLVLPHLLDKIATAKCFPVLTKVVIATDVVQHAEWW
jgi:hypothetical protein